MSFEMFIIESLVNKKIVINQYTYIKVSLQCWGSKKPCDNRLSFQLDEQRLSRIWSSETFLPQSITFFLRTALALILFIKPNKIFLYKLFIRKTWLRYLNSCCFTAFIRLMKVPVACITDQFDFLTKHESVNSFLRNHNFKAFKFFKTPMTLLRVLHSWYSA